MASLSDYGFTDEEILAIGTGNGLGGLENNQRERARLPYYGSPQDIPEETTRPGPRASVGRAIRKFYEFMGANEFGALSPSAIAGGVDVANTLARDVGGNLAGVGAGLGQMMSSNLTGSTVEDANNTRKRIHAGISRDPATTSGRNALANMGAAMQPVVEPIAAGFNAATEGMDVPSKEMLGASLIAGMDLMTGGRGRAGAVVPDAAGTAYARSVKSVMTEMQQSGAFDGMTPGQVSQVERAMFNPQARAQVMQDPVMAQAVNNVADAAYPGYAAARAEETAMQMPQGGGMYPDPYFDEIAGRRDVNFDPLYPEPLPGGGQLMPAAGSDQMGYGIQEWSKSKADRTPKEATDLRYPLGGDQTPAPGPSVSSRRVAKTGQYRGAPQGLDTPQKLGGLRTRLRDYAIKGLPGRDWYDRSSEAALDVAGGRPGVRDRYAAMNAVTSSGTKVQQNTMHGNKAYNQGLNQDPIVAGRFPQEMGRTSQSVWDSGERWYRDMPDLGDKRWPFYNALRVDPENPVTRPTHDIVMARAFGYTEPNGKLYSSGLGEARHRFMDEELTRLTQKANEEEWGGYKDWTLERMQAAIWTAKRSEVDGTSIEEAAKSYPDYYRDYSANVTLETMPSN